MPRFRIFVGDMPRLLRDIFVDAVHSHDDVEVVAADGPGGGAADDAAVPPDAVIVGARALSSRDDWMRWLVANPRLKLVIVAEESRTATVIDMRGHPIEEPSPREVVDAIIAAFDQAAL